MNRIQSKNHKLETQEINKIFFSSFDVNRYILKDGIKYKHMV